ncbi:glycosyltransferase family 2 protein [Murimonas intestini]|uniref:Cellulose synthase/poly-beta-1,6-N-acetylglucosamine synthase-like glycosyltransferase n=1 Tax=Murimonas intestini TaxID=1337051 RepID=A0AB73T9S4_9FIRM|nr:glycosyltransferase [Murimonas intestini]MCR1839172.1 glycosyltransferase family 2 protein [Murimonas intestini]MCR1864468.1 glycosyltransferase family 2 protein [Murimonas intestini]MCR1882078.1 glycosyltransferase family 2 protein [Murimonas intestini]
MINAADAFLRGVGVFFIVYLILYASYLFFSVTVGAWKLYQRDKMQRIRNELKHDYYMPVSVLVPAYNEEVTIADSVESLLNLDYRLYEIIVVDDGSKDRTAEELIKAYHLRKVQRPIHKKVACKPHTAIYETKVNNIRLTLICKENGGKGDALNMGINASRYPYFLCLDADSMLQRDSLEKIVQPVMEDDNIVAVGGLIRVAQCVVMEKGTVKEYHMPLNPITCMQVVEYDRSFLASRILMDQFNGNLIISGAFGLFKKDVAVAAGGYDTDTLGEDMELVVKLHVFCRNNQIKYSIRYEPNAVCWSQAPSCLKDLMKQRRRWHLGLFQSMTKYHQIFANFRFGLISFISYLYYLLFELLSPVIEVFGLLTMVLAFCLGLLNLPFMIEFFLIYSVYGAILTMTAFFQRIYTQGLKISAADTAKAVWICLLEGLFFRYILAFVRATAFVGYKRRKREWGSIKRISQQDKNWKQENNEK